MHGAGDFGELNQVVVMPADTQIVVAEKKMKYFGGSPGGKS